MAMVFLAAFPSLTFLMIEGIGTDWITHDFFLLSFHILAILRVGFRISHTDFCPVTTNYQFRNDLPEKDFWE
jgi:hypothetical protein